MVRIMLPKDILHMSSPEDIGVIIEKNITRKMVPITGRESS